MCSWTNRACRCLQAHVNNMHRAKNRNIAIYWIYIQERERERDSSGLGFRVFLVNHIESSEWSLSGTHPFTALRKRHSRKMLAFTPSSEDCAREHFFFHSFFCHKQKHRQKHDESHTTVGRQSHRDGAVEQNAWWTYLDFWFKSTH